MDFLTPDKVVGTYDLRSDVKNTSTIPPGYVPPLIQGLSLEDSVQSTSWSTSKHKPHTLYLGINHGYNDTSSLDSIFSQSNTLNQNVITTTTAKTISNDKSSHRNKSSTVPNVMKIVRKSYDTLDVGRNRYEKHLKADPELIAQQITLIELEYFQAIEADEFYTLKWNSKEKLQYAPNIVASTRWFNQIIFWVQKYILNEKSLSKRTEILSHFIRIAKKLVDFNNFSSGMAIISALNMQCIHRLNATWSHLTSRDRHTFRKLADLFSQEENFINLRTAVDHSRLPCIPYLGIYLSDLTFIDVAASSLNNRRENSTWTNQGKQDRINNILRIIANFQQSNYPFVRNESIASYLEAQRYIEELQRFIEDANYKLSIQLEPPPTSSPPDLSRQNSSYTVPPNYSFLSSINSSNDNILKPIPIYNCTTSVTSNCDTITTTTTLSSIKTTTSSSPLLSCKTPTMNNKTTRVRHPNKGNAEHMTSNSTVSQLDKQIKSNPTLCNLLGPPMIPPPPRVKQTYSQEDISIPSSNYNPVVNSVQRPRKKPTHRKLGSWGGFGLLFSDNDATPTIDKTDNKQNSSTSTTSTTTNTGSSSHLLPRSPHFKRNVKLSVNNPESTKNSLSNQNHGFAKRSSPIILKRYMNNNNDNSNNNNNNTKTSNQPNGDLYFMFGDHPSSNSSRSSPHLLVFTDCLNKPDNHKQSIKKEQMISRNSMPIYSSSSNNSVIELQCIMQSKSTYSRNQSSIFPDDISNAKTVPGTPCRRIKQHHNYTNMGMSNLEQKRSTNLTTTDDDHHHHNSTSNGKKISVTKLLHHNSSLNSPSMFYQSSQKDHSFNNCTTPLTNHYRLSQTYPFVLPTTKIRSSSLHLPELSSHQQQQQHSSTNLSHLALAALAAVQVTISNNDDDKYITKDKDVTFIHHRHHHHSPVLMSTSNYSCSQSSSINSTYLNIKLANNLEVIREGPLLCCTTSLTSFKIAKFHSSSSVNSSTSPSQLSTSFTDRFNFSTISSELQVNCSQSPVKHKSNIQPNIDYNLNEIHSPPTINANLSCSYSSQTSLSSMKLDSSTSLSSSSNHHNHSVHKGEQSTEYLNEQLYSPQPISTSCNCKCIKKSRRLHKKYKNYWAVLLISLNNTHSISNECVFLVLFKTYTKSLKQFIPWSIISSNLNPLKMRKTELLNSPNYYSASRCKVLRIQDACFDKHNTQSLLKDNCIHPTVLVLENYSSKEKVYRLMCPIAQYSCTQPMTCRNSNRSSSKIIEHVDQLDVACNSDIQITNNTHRDVIPSWLWTTRTVHRFSQIIKQKFGTIFKINQSKHDLSSNTTTANLTTTTTTTTIPSNDYLLNKSFQWIYPLLTLFPSASQQVSKHIFQTSSFLNLSTME